MYESNAVFYGSDGKNCVLHEYNGFSGVREHWYKKAA